MRGCMCAQGAKSKYMQELQKERDTLAKEKTALLQKLAAVTQAGAEERKRLEQTYKDKLTSVEKRLKDLAEREKAAKRNAAQLVSGAGGQAVGHAPLLQAMAASCTVAFTSVCFAVGCSLRRWAPTGADLL